MIVMKVLLGDVRRRRVHCEMIENHHHSVLHVADVDSSTSKVELIYLIVPFGLQWNRQDDRQANEVKIFERL